MKNKFNINDFVYAWEMENGVPELVKYCVKQIMLDVTGYIFYMVTPASLILDDDIYTKREDFIFPSQEKAVEIINKKYLKQGLA